MSIEPDPFERLSKLLALKKFEKPPPRYFLDFSDRVIAQIEAAQEARAQSWWQWLGLDFSLKPALVSVMGLVMTAGLLTGVLIVKPSSGPQEQETSAVQYVLGESSVQSVSREEVPSSITPVVSAVATASPFSPATLRAERASWVMR